MVGQLAANGRASDGPMTTVHARNSRYGLPQYPGIDAVAITRYLSLRRHLQTSAAP